MKNGKIFQKQTAHNEGFGVRRGVVSWDTSQDFGSFVPVRAFVKPRPTPSPRHVICNLKEEHCIMRNNFEGCIIGGAIGDAWGSSYEFESVIDFSKTYVLQTQNLQYF